jgi:hypothetical protein
LFSAFPISSDYIVVSPRFSKIFSEPLNYPWQRTNKIDVYVTEKVVEGVSRYMSTEVNLSDYHFNNETCLANFFPDNGFLLDLCSTNKQANEY